MSHDDAPGFTHDDYTAAFDAFGDAITGALDEPDNLAAVKAAFYRWAEEQYRHGSFAISVERLIADHLWMKVNTTAATTTRKMLLDIDAGRIAMPLDVWLDQPMTVGKHRRILVRHYTPSDGARMIAERKENEEKAKASRIEVQQQVARLNALVVAHGSLPSALAAGALVLDQPAA